jgi:Uma2 family endonuclease
MSAVVKTRHRLGSPSPIPRIQERRTDAIPSLYRFSVAQYEKMLEVGVLTGEDRVELIEGIVVRKMTQYPPHAVTIDYALDALRPLLPDDWRLREQKPIQLSDSQPEPDLVIVRGPLQRYERRHPRPADLAVVLEVADTTLDWDRREKGRSYARARIAVYWIINLNDRQVEVYTEPKGGKSPGYRRHTNFSSTEDVPVVIEGKQVGQVAVRDLLPSTGGSPST